MTEKKDKAVTLRDRAEDVYDNAREKAVEAYDSARDAASKAGRDADEDTRELQLPVRKDEEEKRVDAVEGCEHGGCRPDRDGILYQHHHRPDPGNPEQHALGCDPRVVRPDRTCEDGRGILAVVALELDIRVVLELHL